MGLIKGMIIRAMMNSILKLANGIIFVSRYRMDELKTICKGRVFLIENPIRNEFFIEHKAGNQKQEKIILFVGMISRRKRITDLLSAFSSVLKMIIGARLHIVGPVLILVIIRN